MRVTSKGQVTIPVEIRNAFGLMPDAEVEFVVVDGVVTVRKREDGAGRGRALVSHLRGRWKSDLSTDQLMAMTRGEP